MAFRPPLPIPSTPHFDDDGKPSIQKAQWLTSVDNMFGSFNATPGGSVLGNASTTTGMAVPTTLTALLDAVFGTGRGSILVRGASSWSSLLLGTTTYVLSSNGTDLVYAAPAVAGRTLLSTLTANTSTSLSDTSSLTNAYNTYEIVFENILPGTSANTLQFQVHSGGAFKSSGYINSGVNGISSGTPSVVTNTACVMLTSSTGLANAAPGLSGYVRISQPSTSAIHPIWGQTSYGTTAVTQMLSVGGYWTSSAAVDGFQISLASGTITSGKVYVYGLL